jgi:LuxR family transcriptional regulator, quorum-sensing system regulator SdiA
MEKRVSQALRDEVREIVMRIESLASSGFVLGFNLGVVSADYMFQTYPPAWLQIYDAEVMLLKDPTVAWCMRNTGVVRWEDLHPLDEHGVLSRAREHGLKHGFTIALDFDGRRSAGGFARRDFTDAEIADVRGNFGRLYHLGNHGGRVSHDMRLAMDACLPLR